MSIPTEQTITLITGRAASGKTRALRETAAAARSHGVATVEVSDTQARATPYLSVVACNTPAGALVLFDDGTHEDLNRVTGLATQRPDLHFALVYETDGELSEMTLHAA